MKRILVLMGILLLTGTWLQAGVVKQAKSQVTFKGFGVLSMTTSEKLTAERKYSEASSDFKGKGILGGMASKLMSRAGSGTEIIDLPAMTIFRLDPKKKEYRASPIEKLKEAEGGGKPGEEPAGQAQESKIKIIRTEFKVEKTGEAKDINQFPCQKYAVTWLVEWENTETGEKGTDQLLTDVWTTPLTGALQTALEEESTFSKKYLQAMGIDAEGLQRDVLGTEWLDMLRGLNPAGGSSRLSGEKAQTAQELRKVEGYPIVVDGKYTSVRQGGPEPAQEESRSGGGIGGRLGKFAAKALAKKDKKPEGTEPALAFYSEVLSLAVGDVEAAVFQVPPDYKKK